MNIEVSAIGSLTDFARNTKKHTEELLRTGKPRVLTHNGEAALVVQSAEEYEQLAELAYERKMDESLKRSLDQVAAGESGISLEDFHASMIEKYPFLKDA